MSGRQELKTAYRTDALSSLYSADKGALYRAPFLLLLSCNVTLAPGVMVRALQDAEWVLDYQPDFV